MMGSASVGTTDETIWTSVIIWVWGNPYQITRVWRNDRVNSSRNYSMSLRTYISIRWKTYNITVSIMNWMRNQLWMRWLDPIKGNKRWQSNRWWWNSSMKYGNAGKPQMFTDWSPKYDRKAMHPKRGRMPYTTKRPNRMW